MPRITIRNHRTGQVIYEGAFATAKDCVEQAVRDGASLDYADLRHVNLANAALDDMVLRHGLLERANLSGANLSEAKLEGTSFINAALQNACLCFSELSNCDFTGATFGATDVTGSTIRHGRFSTLSALTLNFIDTALLDRCSFVSVSGPACVFSAPPLVLQGLDWPVACWENALMIGPALRRWEEWNGAINDNAAPSRQEKPCAIQEFFERHRAVLCQLAGMPQHASSGTGKSTARQI